MRKIKMLVLMMLVSFLSINTVYAACSSEDNIKLNKAAININPSYEVKEGEYQGEVDPPDGEDVDNPKVTYFYHKIYISNLTEDLYVVVTNNKDKTKKTLRYEDGENGIVSFDWNNLWEITDFIITVYSSDKTNCPDTKLYTTYLTTPLYNDFSTYEACSGLDEFYLCYQFLTVPQVDFNTFVELTNKYREGKIDKNGDEIKDKEEEKGFVAFVKKHKVMIGVTAMVIVVAGGIVTVIIVRKQRRVI